MLESITRRRVLSLPFLAPAFHFRSLAQARRLNVLFIAVDDLNNRIGCYGDPVVQTPHIDRLAARGVRFDHAYCQYPLCNPSRTSLLSGRRPDTTRIFDNNTPPRTFLKDVVFLPEYFRQHGYFTARVGKVAHGKFEDALTWDISEQARGLDGGKAQAKAARRQEGGAGKLAWVRTDRRDEQEPDGHTARRVVQILEENRNKPFFIGAGFHKPHLPWVAPKKYFELYPPEKIELPKTPPDDRDDIPPIALTHTKGDDELTDLDKKKAIAAYHACTTFTDAQVGVLLESMDRLRLWENTVVLLFGDHGWHLDDHLGLWRKMTVFEEVARAPLIVAAPRRQSKVGCPRLVEFVDIYPSLTELCGLPAPPGMEGTSFVPLLGNPQRPWKKAAFTQVRRAGNIMGRSARTDRYRYTEWGGEEVAELYDHEKDIHEFRNLAADRASAKVKEEMHRTLQQGWRPLLSGL